MRLLNKLRKARGDHNEERVREALEALAETQNSRVSNGEPAEYIISNFWQTKKFSKADVDGTDFRLNLLSGEYLDFETIVDLQVKSSKRGANEHRLAHPDVPVVIVNPLVTDEQLMEKLDCIMKDAIRSGNAVSSI